MSTGYFSIDHYSPGIRPFFLTRLPGYSLAPSFKNQQTFVKDSAKKTGINKTLHTVVMMFVDYRTGLRTTSKQLAEATNNRSKSQDLCIIHEILTGMNPNDFLHAM